MNRALRTLTENGVLDRKRKAGTRVALHPVGKATLSIPVIRQEIEEKGQTYGYAMTAQSICAPPLQIRLSMETNADVELLHVTSLHTGDNAPYTHGEISFSAINVTPEISELLAATIGSALFQMQRTTDDNIP